jgi:enoyl-CoA hydratase/carnithine racemase
MTMASIGIEVERKASLAIVTIARQDRLNAFNQAMFEALEDAARGLSKGTLPRAVIITGAGPNAFCAGFDVNPDNPMVAEMARAVDRGEKTPILTARRIGADEACRFGGRPYFDGPTNRGGRGAGARSGQSRQCAGKRPE